MSIKDKLEQDITSFFNDIENQLSDSKKKTLMLLFDKYIHLSSSATLWDNTDLQNIKSSAIRLHNDRNWPKRLGRFGTISGGEVAQICLVEATISYLYSEDCLKKLPKFDYKE